MTTHLRRHAPCMSHGDVFEVKNHHTAQNLRYGLQDAQFEHGDCGLEDLLDGILSRIPVAHAVDQHAPTALGLIGWHRDHIVVAYIPHLFHLDLLMDFRVFLLEVVVVHYLLKNFFRKRRLVLASRFVVR